MADEQEVNADLSAHVIIHSNDMAWEETGAPGLTRKRFELLLDPLKGRETSLYKFDPGVALPEFPLDERTEIMVLEGTVSDGQRTYDKGVYVRIPPLEPVALSSETGCVILVRKRQGVGEGTSRIVHDSNAPDAWEDWGGRGLLLGDFGLTLYSNGIGAKQEYIKKNPKVVKGFVRAALRGWKDAMDNPAEAADLQRKYVKALKKQITIEELAILKNLAVTPDTKKHGFGWFSPAKMKASRDFMVKNTEIKGTPPKAEDLYLTGFLPATPILP
jgi:hypothetical protein